MVLEKPGLTFKVYDSSLGSPLDRIIIESNIKYAIPKPAEPVVLTELFSEVSIEMHYVDDVFQISLSYIWISTIYKKHGDYYFEPICERIENLYRKRYAKKPDYAVDFIIVKLREWLSMGFKQFMENYFYPVGPKKTIKTMEQVIQEYKVNGLVSEKYFNNLVTSKVSPPVSRQLESLSHQLPGVYEYVKPICCCIAVCNWAKIGDGKVQLWTYIQHLNDAKTHTYYVNKEAGECEVREAYTREEIADWLETLDIDIRFKTPERIRNEQD